jgi:hypothetical protein
MSKVATDTTASGVTHNTCELTQINNIENQSIYNNTTQSKQNAIPNVAEATSRNKYNNTEKNTQSTTKSITLVPSQLHINNISYKEAITIKNDRFGDKLIEKDSKDVRIYFQNINSIQPRNSEKLKDIIKYLKEHQINICGLAEPCANSTNKKTINLLKTTTYNYYTRGTISLSKNNNPSANAYQPGGSALLADEIWSSKKIEDIQDHRHWGRFVGSTYRIEKDINLVVMSCYRCVRQSQDSVGAKTSLRFQKNEIQKLGIQSTVRKLCLNDITETINKYKEKYVNQTHFIIMIDANESLTEDASQIAKFIETNDLIDPTHYLHKIHCPLDTHERSHSGRCIDFIFISNGLKSKVKASGYLPFYEGLQSDHRGIFLDLKLQQFHEKPPYVPPKRTIGTHESKQTIINYQQYIDEQFKSQNIYKRSSELFEQSAHFQNTDDFKNKLNSIDKQITEIVLAAERRKAVLRHATRWSPQIDNISKFIRYWRICIKGNRTRRDVERIKDSVLHSISESHRNQLLNMIPLSTDPNQALKQALKIKQQYLRSDWDLHVQHRIEVARRTQMNIKTTTLNKQAYTKRCHTNIRIAMGNAPKGGLSSIDVPIMDEERNIVKWHTVRDPNTIENLIIQRNIQHFGQARDTPLVQSRLGDKLQYNGTNQVCRNLIKGELPEDVHELDKPYQEIIKKLADGNNLLPMDNNITFDEFMKALNKWKEQTSTSPSGRHLGHYKVLLVNILDQEDIDNKQQ